MTAPEFLPADLVFTHGEARLSQAIRWASRSQGEAATYASHVAGFVGGEYVVEARWRVVKRAFSEVAGPLQVWRNVGLTDWDRARIATKARSYVGRGYGGAKIAAHLGDALLSKVFGGSPFVFRRLARYDNYPICSWVWACAFAEVGYRFGLPPEAAQPDDMHDWCAEHPDHWVRVCTVTV